MTDHPGTFGGESVSSGFDWTEEASLHRSDDGGGVFGALKAVRHDTIAELVRFVMALPEDERGDYEIEKKGDHRLTAVEIAALARRDDFPPA